MGKMEAAGTGIGGGRCRRWGWAAAALFSVLIATAVIPRRAFFFRISKQACQLADSRKYTGIVEDCACGYETVDSLNKEVLHPILQELVATPFFRYFKDWRCNTRSYSAYRNFMRRPRNWESQITQSYLSTPSNSGHWASSQGPQSILFDTESQSSSRDLRGFGLSVGHRSSFSSNDADHQFGLVEPAYSFVGMHCIFDNCKASVTILKFGHMSFDLLAYGATDGSLTVCHASESPSVIQHLKGHSKAITGLTQRHQFSTFLPE